MIASLLLDLTYLLTLVQGELLDQIEYTVGQSVNYTGRAVEELRTANKYQKKVRAPERTPSEREGRFRDLPRLVICL